MDLKPLKEKLGDDTFAALEKHVADLTGQRDAARAESIDGRKKLKAEVDSLRAVRNKLYDKLGLDDDADLDALPDAKGQAEAAKQFEQRLKRLEKDKAELSDALDGARKGHRDALMKIAVGQAMGSVQWTDADLAAMTVGAHVRWDETAEEPRFFVDDKALTLAEGMQFVAKKYPMLIKAQGQPGSGQQPGAGSAAGGRTMTRADFESLSPQQKMDAIKGGTTLT